MEIHNGIMDIHNGIVAIHNSIMGIHNYIPRTEGSGDVMVLRQSRPPPGMVLTR